ncbi:MAG: DUF4923 family protein [Methanimicrococcus sp.]|nr:DUF4923 family protein [Methanimicrococcus sp.]MCL2141956.1 DUF4923 family protein [Methanimicrococcus sp.]
MKHKTITLISLIMILTLVTCLFAGCLGDKIVGTWNAKNSSATITFNKDNTFTAKVGLLNTNGTWEKSGSEYILYGSGGTRIGSAVFVGKELRLVLGGGILSISEDFTKQK